MNYSGVTIDFYDDNGATIKARFPTYKDLPDVIKEASIKPKDRLANEDFALVAINEGTILRKFACHDPGTTAMSVIYLMEHGDKLPPEAVKTAAAALVEQCLGFGLIPPEAIQKEAVAYWTQKGCEPIIGLSKIADGDEPEDAEAVVYDMAHELSKQAGFFDFLKGKKDETYARIPYWQDEPRGKPAGYIIEPFDKGVQYGPGTSFMTREGLEKWHPKEWKEFTKQSQADIVSGGKADTASPGKFPPKQIQMGQEVEMEHTDTPALAREIARDHLTEFPDYYTRLKKMEEEAKAAKEKKAGLWDFLTGGGEKQERKIQEALEYAERQRAKGVKGYEYIHPEDLEKAKEKKAQIELGGRGLGPGKGMGLRAGCPVAEAKKKLLSKLEKKSSIVDITGKKPAPVVKTAMPNSDSDYAVILPNGQRYYPIDTHSRVKMAEAYLLNNWKSMAPAIRRQYAVKLAAKAEQLGCRIDDMVKEAGAPGWASSGHVRASLEMRKIACVDQGGKVFLTELFEKRAGLGPEMFSEILQRFDNDTGLSLLWDQRIPDPWSSTYGIQKIADRVVWENGAERVTQGELENLAVNRLGILSKHFTDDFANEFRKDPVGIFNSMPLPHKKILSRLAVHVSADGSSEIDSEAPAAGEYKSL